METKTWAIMGVILGVCAICNGEISVIPRPVSLTEGEGSFIITPKTRILYERGQNGAGHTARYLADILEPAMGYPLKIDDTRSKNAVKNAILLTTRGVDRDALGTEGYTLTVTPKSVTIKAASVAGLFYGVQTLRQLLPPQIMRRQPAADTSWSVPTVNIQDSPRFEWRGMHLDVCRHYFPAKDVMKYIDLLAFYKFNTLHWHLTEDQGWRIEIKKYPRLTEVGSIRDESPVVGNRNKGDGTPYGPYFYTQDEVREIVAYAKSRHITVVPEIELPGHSMAALVAYPELGCTEGPYKVRTRWGVEPDIYCAGNEKVFEFLDNVMAEVLELFPSEFIHIGGDEAPKKRWDKCPKCQARIKQEGLHNSHELQSWFIKRIEKGLNAEGRKLIGWDEILEGGLAPNAAVMSWRGERGGITAAKAGHDVVMTPNSHCYFDHYQSTDHSKEPEAIGGFLPLKKVYNYEPVPAALTAAEAAHVLGAQGNVWTEYIHDYSQVEYMAAPRLCALSEVVWSPKTGKEYADFHKRLTENVKHLDSAKINYRQLDKVPVVLGSWKSGQTSDTWAVMEWDITGKITKLGPHKITFSYTTGKHRLDISKVEILGNGKSVAQDEHLGITGVTNKNNTYTLTSSINPSTVYTLRARVRSDGGADSNGNIVIAQ